MSAGGLVCQRRVGVRVVTRGPHTQRAKVRTGRRTRDVRATLGIRGDCALQAVLASHGRRRAAVLAGSRAARPHAGRLLCPSPRADAPPPDPGRGPLLAARLCVWRLHPPLPADFAAHRGRHRSGAPLCRGDGGLRRAFWCCDAAAPAPRAPQIDGRPHRPRPGPRADALGAGQGGHLADSRPAPAARGAATRPPRTLLDWHKERPLRRARRSGQGRAGRPRLAHPLDRGGPRRAHPARAGRGRQDSAAERADHGRDGEGDAHRRVAEAGVRL